MDIVTDALMLRAVDYGENDKIITLLTATHGKIGCKLTGVKRPTARLKFAGQPFCFAEYVLAEKNGRYTVTSASLQEGFYPLRENVLSYYAGMAVCETCDKLLFEGMDSGELLVCALNALKEICKGEQSLPLISFLLSALSLSGYPVRAEECPFCGGEISGRSAFDMESGAFVCGSCGHGTPASEVTYHTVRRALKGEEGTPSPDGEKRALKLLSAYLYYQAETEISSLLEYIKMI